VLNALRTFYQLTLSQVVFVTFDELSLEPHFRCIYDVVSVYDGSSDNSSLLGKFCTVSTIPRWRIVSNGPSMLIVFQTDESVNAGRFALSWKFGWFITNASPSYSAWFSYAPSIT